MNSSPLSDATSLVLRKCKSIQHEVPTVAVSDESFVAPVGVVICKIVQGQMGVSMFKKVSCRLTAGSFLSVPCRALDASS